MKLIATMPVRNEDWCLGLTARAVLMWVDHLVLFLHACEDHSLAIADEVALEHQGRVTLMFEPDPKWDEMAQRQRMLDMARSKGATHIAIVDADEILTGNLLNQTDGGTWASEARHGIADGCILTLPGYNLRNGLTQYHANGIWARRWFSLAFKDDLRLSWSGDKFHQREPQGIPLQPYKPISQSQGGIMHLWGASERRLKAKSAWYKVTERLRWPEKSVQEIDRMYSWAIHGNLPHDPASGWLYAKVPDDWWAPYQHLMRHLHLYAEPWQEREAQRLVAEHGVETFAGLDLFGVA